MRKLALVLTGATVAAVACVATHITRLHPEMSYPKICPEGVAIFTSAAKADTPYVEVAVLSSTGSQNYTNQAQMYESQRKKAAEVGANGLILGETHEAGTGAVVANALLGTPADRRGRAIAIYIERDSARVRQACAGRH